MNEYGGDNLVTFFSGVIGLFVLNFIWNQVYSAYQTVLNKFGVTRKPSEKAIVAYKDLIKDKSFENDLVKVVTKHGNFDDFIKKQSNDDEFSWDNITWKKWQSWESKNEAAKVVKDLLNTSTFKGRVKRYNLDENDIQFIGNMFMYMFTNKKFSNDLNNFAKSYIDKKKKTESKISLNSLI